MNIKMIQIRRANINDLNTLVLFRVALFKEMERLDGVRDEQSFHKACEQFFYQFIPKEEFLSWVAETNGKIIATSGLVFFQKPPSPGNNSGKEAYIMNMYTLPEWRKKGITSKLMTEILVFLRKKKITVISLHTTEIGRNVYEEVGFVLTNNEMKLSVKSSHVRFF